MSIKQGYYPPTGRYHLVIAYKNSFKDVEFTELEGKLGVLKDGVFYDMDKIFLAEEDNQWHVRAVKNTQIARKMHGDAILKEEDKYLILKGNVYA